MTGLIRMGSSTFMGTRRTTWTSKKRMPASKSPLAAILAVALLLVANGRALANPAGEAIVAGSVNIQRQQDLTRIEASDGAIIDWHGGFDIGSKETVEFLQPGSFAHVLNRDFSLNATQIDGRLLANGHVTIANPFGIYFGDTAIVDVGHLVAAAGHISNDDFLAGDFAFHGLEGTVENQGLIRAQNVALIGRQVANHGQVVTSDGSLFMLAGDEVWIGDWGSPVRIGLGPIDTNGPAVTNTGELDAGRGRARMAAGDVLGLAVRNQGSIRAADIAVSSEGGDVVVAGTLDASDRSTGGKGGRIEVLGERVAIDEAILDASGDAGGGEILVGGDFQGANPAVRNASRSVVGTSAVLRADATREGDGGKVIVWADEATGIYGEISARGGSEGGNGGFVETSSRAYLEVAGARVDASAPRGAVGEWLLDPRNVQIEDLPTDGGSFSGGDPDIFTPDATGTPTGPAIVDRNTIQAALNSGTSVTVKTTQAQVAQDGDITVVDSITSSVPQGSSPTLKLAADRDININASISDAAGDGTLEVELEASRTVAFKAPITVPDGGVTVVTDNQGGGSILDQSPSEAANIAASRVDLTATARPPSKRFTSH